MIVGHSLGEYAAAVVAGVLTIEECLKLVCLRASLVDRNKDCKGRMIAARLSESDARAFIAQADVSEYASVAAVNGERSVVMSGSNSAISKVSALLSGNNIGCSELRVTHAFHSPMLNGIVQEYAAILADTVPQTKSEDSIYSARP
jgi:acyl transferase domain-containing protein